MAVAPLCCVPSRRHRCRLRFLPWFLRVSQVGDSEAVRLCAAGCKVWLRLLRHTNVEFLQPDLSDSLAPSTVIHDRWGQIRDRFRVILEVGRAVYTIVHYCVQITTQCVFSGAGSNTPASCRLCVGWGRIQCSRGAGIPQGGSGFSCPLVLGVRSCVGVDIRWNLVGCVCWGWGWGWGWWVGRWTRMGSRKNSHGLSCSGAVAGGDSSFD
jgi:hypothetical protein